MKNLSFRKYERHSYQSGEIFGRLTLTGASYLAAMYGQRRRVVEAVCKCGIVKWYPFHALICRDTKSCGCYLSDSSKKRMTTHGLTQHPLYDVRRSMINRCHNEKDKGYKRYGARGISVCEEWQEDFKTFYDWAILNGWKEGLEIDRVNNDGNYYPGNCRFVTREQSMRNYSRNKMITAFGETKCLFDWGKDIRCKITDWGLRVRYDSGKWTDMEKMITTPILERKKVSRRMKSNRNLTAWGITKCFSAWLEDKRCLVKIDSLRDRLAKGWSAQKAMGTPPTRDGKNGYCVSPLKVDTLFLK